jgi:hypothetical protein
MGEDVIGEGALMWRGVSRKRGVGRKWVRFTV